MVCAVGITGLSGVCIALTVFTVIADAPPSQTQRVLLVVMYVVASALSIIAARQARTIAQLINYLHALPVTATTTHE